MRVLCVEIEMIFKLFVRGVIMFYFINFDTPTKSENYDKGVLFERLCKDLLDASGYNDIEMRLKRIILNMILWLIIRLQIKS